MRTTTKEQYEEAKEKIRPLHTLWGKTGDKPESIDRWQAIIDDYENPNSCPFCEDREKLEVILDRKHGQYVQCMVCLASGPYGKTREEAVELWDKAKR